MTLSLATVLLPDGAPLLLAAGAHNGFLRVLGSGADGALQLQASLGGHSRMIYALTVMYGDDGGPQVKCRSVCPSLHAARAARALVAPKDSCAPAFHTKKFAASALVITTSISCQRLR